MRFFAHADACRLLQQVMLSSSGVSAGPKKGIPRRTPGACASSHPLTANLLLQGLWRNACRFCCCVKRTSSSCSVCDAQKRTAAQRQTNAVGSYKPAAAGAWSLTLHHTHLLHPVPLLRTQDGCRLAASSGHWAAAGGTLQKLAKVVSQQCALPPGVTSTW
jgi:hypothetical protein